MDHFSASRWPYLSLDSICAQVLADDHTNTHMHIWTRPLAGRPAQCPSPASPLPAASLVPSLCSAHDAFHGAHACGHCAADQLRVSGWTGGHSFTYMLCPVVQAVLGAHACGRCAVNQLRVSGWTGRHTFTRMLCPAVQAVLRAHACQRCAVNQLRVSRLTARLSLMQHSKQHKQGTARMVHGAHACGHC
eukprot:1158688-Pelagomonas_calceolata.AAC.11